MNVNQRNQLLSIGEIDRQDLWPKITEYKNRRFRFRWEFGLDALPQEPGVLVIRGPRQVGKSTWIELQLEETVREFGGGSGYFLNGDYIYSHNEFEAMLLEIETAFSAHSKVKRLFIDEVTQIPDWQRVIKRLIDAGHLRDVLIITTGSNAADLLHGKERLPGRKGRLSHTEYLFLPISYREFCYTVGNEIDQLSNHDLFWSYVLTGGSPLAVQELFYDEMLTDNFISIVTDWIVGDLVASGRSRHNLLNLLKQLYRFAPNPVSYTKLAKESGLANNTTALDYIERLHDLLIVHPLSFFDIEKGVHLSRKPSKFCFINLPAALIFHPSRPRYLHELRQLEEREKGALYEWVVGHELWRRNMLKIQQDPSSSSKFFWMGYWKSDFREIDYVLEGNQFFEVKSGKTTPFEFSWFPKLFPGQQLTVVGESEFETNSIKGVEIEKFLWSAPSNLIFNKDKEYTPFKK